MGANRTNWRLFESTMMSLNSLQKINDSVPSKRSNLVSMHVIVCFLGFTRERFGNSKLKHQIM